MAGVFGGLLALCLAEGAADVALVPGNCSGSSGGDPVVAGEGDFLVAGLTEVDLGGL